ncbi:hypothetical protein ASF22_08135 [Methylobacterium sp. Leaf87]|uniref:hypothetical protein n=1 Tax=Methylobacterium sp. Leaf87 TaxID=1736243 RepID=UPI0006F7D92E|nr:hypothetical protein [Methylobacterium sp. Leaf87]KQO59597.1 hypothetical protein ASF22_08135 [Methylobacterium sp. Leaf87]
MTAVPTQHAAVLAPALAIITDTTSLSALIAANQDLIDDQVPEGGAHPTDADRATWQTSITAMGSVVAVAGNRSRFANSTLLAMAMLYFQHAPDNQFPDAFGEGKFKKPGSNHVFAPAASALFGLNVGDALNKTSNSKRVNSLCSQHDGLLLALREQGLRLEDMQLSRDSVLKVLSVIEKAGGTHALERKEAADDDQSPHPIALSVEEVGRILFARGLSVLAGMGGATPKVVLQAVRPDGTTEEVGEVAENLVTKAVADLAKPLPRTQALAEAMQMGRCVIAEATSSVARPGTDPHSPRTPRRQDEPQMVFHPDGKITWSLLLGPSSVIVEVRTHQRDLILDAAVQGHTRLDTQRRKRVEANILPMERRVVFDVGVEATERATGFGKLLLYTGAASDAGAGKDSVGVLLQGLTGPLPMELSPNLTFLASCKAVPAVFHGYAGPYADNAAKAVKTATRRANPPPDVTITIGAKGFTSSGAKADARPVGMAVEDVQGASSVSVRLDDYVAFLRAFEAVYPEVNVGVVCRAGDHGVCFEFGTNSSNYRVFIPLSVNGVRMNSGVRKIDDVKWPKGASLTPNNEPSAI